MPLAELDDLVFGGWDPIPDNAYEAARTLRRARASTTSSRSATALEGVKPMPAVFDQTT